jgi:hypothetical protein
MKLKSAKTKGFGKSDGDEPVITVALHPGANPCQLEYCHKPRPYP